MNLCDHIWKHIWSLEVCQEIQHFIPVIFTSRETVNVKKFVQAPLFWKSPKIFNDQLTKKANKKLSVTWNK